MFTRKKINLIKKNLKRDGFFVVRNFFNNCQEFRDFKKFLNYTLIKIINQEKFEKKTVDKKISKLFKINHKVSGYLNDNINMSTQLSKLLTSKKLLKLISLILDKNLKDIIFNNQRFRVQIPGNDHISNLPWHQDAHYNKIKKTSSIVAWISISDIEKNMGPLIFKEKSHKIGKMKRINHFRKNGALTFSVNSKNPKIKKLKEFYTSTKSGDLILIDMFTVHTSGKNLDKNKIKYSAQTRFHVLKNFHI